MFFHIFRKESPMDLASLVAAQRAYFRTGATLDLAFRRRALDTLEEALRAREGALLAEHPGVSIQTLQS